MTWSTPAASPSLEPTAPAGRLTLGDIFSSSFRTLFRRLWLFVRLMLMPVLIALVVIAVFVGAILAVVLPNALRGRDADPAGFLAVIPLVLVFYVAMLVVALVQYVYLGRAIIAALDLGTGRFEPTWDSLKARTQGLLGRLVMLVLIIFGLAILIAIAVSLLMAGVFSWLTLGQGNSSAGTGTGAAVAMFLVMAVLGAALVWVSTKLTYTLHGMAEENLRAWDALKRSWSLTTGVFWRTLGYVIVGGLVVGAVSFIPTALGSPLFGNMNEASATSGVLGFLWFLLVMAVSLLTTPFQYIWTSLMYLSRRRELEGGVAGDPWGSSQV